MHRKGVSPLIAVVLLIAFTLAIGGFLSSWLQEFTHEQTDLATENADAGCIYATFNAEDATYNASGSNKLIFDVKSTGTRDINIKQITVTALNMSRLSYTSPNNFSGTVNAGDEIGIVLTIDPAIIQNISRVRIIPSDCPNNADEIKREEITHYS
ncbi:MAG: archaellin/type IV pilin N-terminal domain-containing protein [archaeon]